MDGSHELCKYFCMYGVYCGGRSCGDCQHTGSDMVHLYCMENGIEDVSQAEGVLPYPTIFSMMQIIL